MDNKTTAGSGRAGRTGGGDQEDIAWLIVAAAGLLACIGLWRTQIRPWLAEQDLPLIDVDRGGSLTFDLADLIPLGMFVVAVLGVYLLVRGKVRRRRGREDQS